MRLRLTEKTISNQKYTNVLKQIFTIQVGVNEIIITPSIYNKSSKITK